MAENNQKKYIKNMAENNQTTLYALSADKQ